MTQCQHCGTSFEQKPGKGRPRIFCSYECKEAFHAAKQKAEREASLAGRTCVECGSPIEARNARAQCCSPECSVKYHNRRGAAQRRDARAESRRVARGVRICANPECGLLISLDRKLGTKFCSTECYRRGQSFRLYKNGWMRQHLYGITPEDYAALLAGQDNSCAICRADEAGGKGGWHVDHCHDSKVIRGLLCHHCNLMLGHAKDDSARLRAAADYLERTPP